jgi:RNAse (barnase) inhibitor barstar
MTDLIIKGEKKTYFTPDVNFSANTGICEIAGESYQEETFEFFNRLIAWIDEFIMKVRMPITMNFKLTYFNTSSARAIQEMINLLKKYKEQGGQVVINWYYQDEEDSTYEEAEDMQAQTKMQFNMIKF